MLQYLYHLAELFPGSPCLSCVGASRAGCTPAVASPVLSRDEGSPPLTWPKYYNNINGWLKVHCARVDDRSPHSSDKCHILIADALPLKQQIYPVVLMKNTDSSSLLGLLAHVDYLRFG